MVILIKTYFLAFLWSNLLQFSQKQSDLTSIGHDLS